MKINVRAATTEIKIVEADVFQFRRHWFALHRTTVFDGNWFVCTDFKTGRRIETGHNRPAAKRNALIKLRARWPEYLEISAELPRINRMKSKRRRVP